MIVSEPVEETGFFWLPESPENRFPGFLRISESGTVTLEITSLSNIFAGERSFGDPWAGGILIEFERIVGVTKSGFVTLDGCSETNVSTVIGGLSTSTFNVKQAFIGVGCEKGRDVVFSELRFSLMNLNEWLRISGIEATQKENKSISINYSHPKPIVINISDEFQLKFDFEASVPTGFDINEAKITQKAFVVLISQSEKPLDDFLSLASKIKDFFSFVTTRTAFIDSVSGYSDEIKQRGKDTNYRMPVNIYFREFPSSNQYRHARAQEMFFVFSEIKDRVEVTFRNWIRIYDSYESILDRYFRSNLDYTMDLERRFLILVEGIAAIHIAIHDKQDSFLADRLKEMMAPFQKHFGIDDELDGFVRKVVSARNYLVHLRRRDRDYIPNTEELFELNSKLEAIFQLFLLRSLGIEDEHLDKIAKENRHLRGNLECKAGRA